ncbi:MAG: heavy-metal-associated domain-containing protein [Deltaproteobacteria bacterium]|nr:heavy-metal-associated domain-containing protein [Deltaproteobacteria bacterium]
MAETIVIPIKGMTCSHCVGAIQKALGKVAGVESVTVSLKEKSVTLIVTNNDETTRANAEAAIEDAGYEVRK